MQFITKKGFDSIFKLERNNFSSGFTTGAIEGELKNDILYICNIKQKPYYLSSGLRHFPK